MVKHVLMGRARLGRGEDVKIGLVTPATALLGAVQICGLEMFALHQIARLREYSAVRVYTVDTRSPKGYGF